VKTYCFGKIFLPADVVTWAISCFVCDGFVSGKIRKSNGYYIILSQRTLRLTYLERRMTVSVGHSGLGLQNKKNKKKD